MGLRSARDLVIVQVQHPKSCHSPLPNCFCFLPCNIQDSISPLLWKLKACWFLNIRNPLVTRLTTHIGLEVIGSWHQEQSISPFAIRLTYLCSPCGSFFITRFFMY